MNVEKLLEFYVWEAKLFHILPLVYKEKIFERYDDANDANILIKMHDAAS